jgi:hypothetical protein
MNIPSFTIVSDDSDYKQFKPKLDEIIKEYADKQIGIFKELEIRFGLIDRKRFSPGISKQQFFDLKTLLSQYINYMGQEDTLVQKYGDIRKITFQEGDETFVKFERKKALNNADLTLYPYSIRVALASESDTNLSLQEKNRLSSPDFEKRQVRYRYQDITGKIIQVGYEVHLTEILVKDQKTYEVEIEFIVGKNPITQAQIIQITKFIYALMTKRFSAVGMEKYNNFTKESKNIVYGINSTHKLRYYKPNFYFDNKPEAVYYNNIYEVKNQYGVTNKLDGIYYNLFIIKEGIALINATTFELILSSSSHLFKQLYPKIKDSILVGELYKGILYIFDSVIVQSVYVADKPHEQRILTPEVDTVISELSKLNLSNISFTKKKFLYTQNIVNDIKSEIEYMKNTFKDYQNENDGIIFFNTAGNFMSKIYKWKFPTRISIDGRIILKSSTENQKVFDVFFYRTPEKDEQIYINNNPIQLFVTNDNPFYEQLENNLIVELGWGADKLVAERIRFDKSSPNFIEIAKNTFNQMIKPMDFDSLVSTLSLSSPQLLAPVPSQMLVPSSLPKSQEERNNYRKFANLVKRFLINTYVNSSSNVLDLGAGYGGDLNKYESVNPKNLFLVEPYFYKKLLERIAELENTPFKKNIKTLESVAEDTSKIVQFIGNVPITNINMMNSITFFMADKEFAQLKNTLNLLQQDGTFVCVYMDGERTLKYLRETGGKISSSFYEITDLEPSKTSNPSYTLSLGHKIHFSFKGVTVTEEGQDEYLVPSSILYTQLGLEPLGFEKKSGMYLDDFIKYQQDNPCPLKKRIIDLYNLLSSEEKSLARLYKYEIFTKTKYKNKTIEQKEREQSLVAIKSGSAKKLELSFSNDIYRLGMIGDGSCFVHSILAGVDYNIYKSMTEQEKRSYVYKIRKLMAKNLTFKTWTMLGNGSIAVILIEQSLLTVMNDEQRKRYTQKLPTIDKDNYFIKYIKAISDIVPNLKFVIDTVFNTYKQNLENKTYYIDSYFLEYFSVFFEVNIFIIKDITRHVFLANKYNNSWPSVFILNLAAKYIGEEHFELLIRITKDKVLTSLFEHNDDIVVTLLKQINKIRPYTETVKVVQNITETPVIQEEKKIEEKVVEQIVEKSISDLEKTAIEIISENFMFNEPSVTFEYIIPTSEQSVIPLSELSLVSVSSFCDNKDYLETLKSYFITILTEINMDRFEYKSYNNKNHAYNRKNYQEMAFSDIGDDKYIDKIAKDIKDKDSVCVREVVPIFKQYSNLLSYFDIFYETMMDIFPENITSNIQEMRELYYILKQ